MHPRLSVSAISSLRWSLEEDLAFWAEAGIDQVGIALRKLEPVGLANGARRVAEAGLRVTNVLGLAPFTLHDPTGWPAQRDRLSEAVDAAATMRADCLVVTTGPAGPLTWEQAADAFAEAIAPLADGATAAGVRLAVEHTNSLRTDISFLHTLRDAVDLAGRLGIGVCMEVNACWAERGLAETVAARVDRLAIVQVSDFVVGTLRTPDRAVPGDGDVPLRQILGGVLAAGYDGVFDLELVGPRIEEEGYRSAIERSVRALEDVLTSVGV